MLLEYFLYKINFFQSKFALLKMQNKFTNLFINKQIKQNRFTLFLND
jgi:hypothetical protein